jgi:hypothetical protein
MNDALVPLCQRYGAMLQTELGELSITTVNAQNECVRDLSKPIHMLHVSDFDQARQTRPAAVALFCERTANPRKSYVETPCSKPMSA